RRVGSEFHNAADGAEALERLLPDLAAPTPPPPTAAGAHLTRSGTIPPALGTIPTPSRTTPSPPSTPDPDRIEVTRLYYHHPGRADTLQDLSLSTGPGPGLTALTGPSGAGKTTLLELLAGLRVPTSGQVSAPRAHLATQRPLLLPGTVRENLALSGVTTSDGEMQLALSRVGLWTALWERQGLDTRLGDDGFGLSAGQRGRLALARAALSDAPVILLDEPTAHIAPDTAPMLRAVIVELARHRRVVVATHEPIMAS